MRILIISLFFPPTNSIASLRPHSWAKYWSLAGHDVTVLTKPLENRTEASLSFSNSGFRLIRVKPRFHRFMHFLKAQYHFNQAAGTFQAHQQISFIRKWAKKFLHYADAIRKRRGIFNSCRMPDLADLWVQPALKALGQEGPWDLVVSSCGPYQVHRVAAKLKREGKSAFWIADYRDPWSDNLLFPGIFPFNWIERYLEKKWMHHADIITTVSLPLKKTFEDKYGTERVIVIENGVDPSDFALLDKNPIFPRDGKFRIIHSGTIHDKIYNPFPIVEAIRELILDGSSSHLLQHLEVIFVGSGGKDLIDAVQKYQLSQFISIKPPVAREIALQMQRDADLLLFLLWGDFEIEGILSGKIFEYAYSSTPIISIGGASQNENLKLGGNKIGISLGTSVEKTKAYLIEQLSRHQQGIRPAKCMTNRELIMNHYQREALALKLLDSMRK